jgi:replication factor C subunit 2/4
MAPKVQEEKGESSNAASKKALAANTNGATDYELPWYG